MNKQLLLSSLAAAALLSGCRVYLPGESPRRTVFGSDASSRTATSAPAARVADATAPAKVAPADDLVAPQPVAQTTLPTAAPVSAPAPAAALPPTAGADSYRNYMGGGAGAAPAPATAPRRTVLPAPAPAPAAYVPPAGAHAAGAAADAQSSPYRMYTVQAGDSAGMIANANGMTLAEFAKLNNLSDPNKLRVGQTVKIATGRPALAAGPAARPVQPVAVPAGYVAVQEGDTLSAIAARHGTTVKALMEANGLADANAIRAGGQLRLPGTAATPTTSRTIPTPTRPVAVVPPTTRPVAVVPPTTRPVAIVPTTTRPVATIPTTTRAPARVTVDEATAAPGSTVTAGDATIDVDAALSGGGLGAARQRAQNAVQNAAGQVRDAAQAAGDQAQSALGQVSDAAGRAADAVRSAASAGTREYVVQEGDDIYSIAMQFEAQPLKIRSLNGGKSLDDIKPGDRILVPAN